ncbi:MAG: Trm112 family protein [Candidatus Woesearchaeota archaeon]|jgi:uncharacterized protein YbaR (Trm112 family)|nr:Trm112 family protein [Candidatus Woesearchaeota archaeon]
MTLDKGLLDIVCCPNCNSDLKVKSELVIFCSKCNLEYREKEGILVLISKELEEELRS